ncbi:MAG TPA: transglycosylase SLT domain-containing protein [Candidatus Dormibacteraeota bacterium]|nr:transglycosylase SLT domain-containing protein [Candidatus Dormibacteraeota bacterium]
MALGLAVLTISPIVMASGRHSPVAVASTPTSVASVQPAADRLARTLPVRDPELRLPEATPTPVPTPVPTPPPPPPTATPVAKAAVATPPPAPPPAPGTIEAIIKTAADANGVSYPWMLKIARCESGLNPRAYNASGPYYGLYQFLQSTFRANGGTDIWDPVQQANITAKMLAHGQAHQWGCA